MAYFKSPKAIHKNFNSRLAYFNFSFDASHSHFWARLHVKNNFPIDTKLYRRTLHFHTPAIAISNCHFHLYILCKRYSIIDIHHEKIAICLKSPHSTYDNIIELLLLHSSSIITNHRISIALIGIHLIFCQSLFWTPW